MKNFIFISFIFLSVDVFPQVGKNTPGDTSLNLTKEKKYISDTIIRPVFTTSGNIISYDTIIKSSQGIKEERPEFSVGKKENKE